MERKEIKERIEYLEELQEKEPTKYREKHLNKFKEMLKDVHCNT